MALAEAATSGAQFAAVGAAVVAAVGAALKAFERNLGAALGYAAVGLLSLAVAIGKL